MAFDEVNIYFPILGGVLTLGVIGCALSMCYGRCLDCLKRWQEKRRQDALICSCRKIHYQKGLLGKTCQNETCPICLEDFTRREPITVCPCKHAYHKPCLIGWLINNSMCPVCKYEIYNNQQAAERTPLLN